MSFRTFHVTHSEDEGFGLSLVEGSRFWSFLEQIADKVCVWTRHRFCHRIFNPIASKAWDAEKVLVSIRIDRETAEILSYSPDQWAWLDEDDD